MRWRAGWRPFPLSVINATTLLAAVGDGSAFSRGRDLVAWLGLTPRQHSTRGKTRLLGISKRGTSYLRTQLIHGARAAMSHFVNKPTPMGAWVRQLLTRAHPNVIVAVAAKLACIAWTVVRHGSNYEPQAVTARARDSGQPAAEPRTRSVEVENRWLNG